MPRTHPAQLNIRCLENEKEAYLALAEELGKPLATVVREALNKLVEKKLGSEWTEYIAEE